MLEKLLSRFREPLETSLDGAVDSFREERGEELQEAENRFSELSGELEQNLEELKADLEKLEDYDDYKNRAVVEDVVDNISEDRQRLLEELELPDHPEELQEALEDFLEDFDDLTQKESAVIEEAGLTEEIKEPISGIKRIQDELEEFLEQGFGAKQTLQELEELEDRRQRLQLEIEEKEIEAEEIELEEPREKIEETEQKLQELPETDEWRDYQELQDELKETRERKKEMEQELGKAVNRMERGTKKLVYEIENGDIEFDGDVSILEEIRDGNTEDLADRPAEVVDTVEEATGVLPMDLLGDAVHRKFMDGAEFLLGLEDHHREWLDINDTIEELEREIKSHDARERKEELEQEKKDLEKELDELSEKKKKLGKEIERKEEELSRTEEEIKDTFRSAFKRQVKFGQ